MYSTCRCKHSEEGLCLENEQEENIFVNTSTCTVLCVIQSGILSQNSRHLNVYQDYTHTLLKVFGARNMCIVFWQKFNNVNVFLISITKLFLKSWFSIGCVAGVMFSEQIQTIPYKRLLSDFVCFGQSVLQGLIVFEVLSKWSRPASNPLFFQKMCQSECLRLYF